MWHYMVAYLSGKFRDDFTAHAIAMADAMIAGELGEVHTHTSTRTYG